MGDHIDAVLKDIPVWEFGEMWAELTAKNSSKTAPGRFVQVSTEGPNARVRQVGEYCALWILYFVLMIEIQTLFVQKDLDQL